MRRHSILAPLSLLALCLPALAHQPTSKPAAEQPKPAPAPAAKPDATPQPKPNPKADPNADPKPKPTAAELLNSLRTRYAEATTYHDEGKLHQKIVASATIESDLPFATNFEKDGRFLWEFFSSVTPGGKPTDRYVVWSKDRKAFHSWWSLKPAVEDFDSFEMAMAGPTGISGGSASLVVPLLGNKRGRSVYWPGKPVDEGTETIDGVECRKISGSGMMGAALTLWIDATPDAPALRKVFCTQEIDPAKLPPIPTPDGVEAPKLEKFTTETTITLKPTFNEKLPDSNFNPNLPPEKPAPK